MPLGDVSYMNAALNAVVASFPATGAKWRLYTSDPALEVTPSTVELAATGGYAGVTFAPAQFGTASADLVQTSSPVSFGTSSAAWSDVATFWAIEKAGLLVYSDALDTPIAVDAAGVAVAFTPGLSFSDGA